MANDTIASGGTFTLASALTGGTNIDFLNSPSVSGELIIDPAAFLTTTIVTGGTTAVSGTLGGAILNFQPGDQIILATLDAVYADFDVVGTAAAENTQFDNNMKFSAESGYLYFIENDGAVTASVNSPISNVDANTAKILDEMAATMFGTAAATETVTMAPYLVTSGSLSITDAMFTIGHAVNPCFTAGTRILTVDGEIAVERLVVGNRVINAAGEAPEIIWIGRREVDVTRHPRPEAVWPVVIEPDALSDGVPARRLTISPDHALFLDGALVPARHLVNGMSIRADTAVRHVRYFHVELAVHDVLFAEGTAVESYLDTGHRGVFDNSSEPLLLHPDLMQIRRAREGCARLVTGGEALAVIRERLARRLQAAARLSG
jgi:hypothetical protein